MPFTTLISCVLRDTFRHFFEKSNESRPWERDDKRGVVRGLHLPPSPKNNPRWRHSNVVVTPFTRGSGERIKIQMWLVKNTTTTKGVPMKARVDLKVKFIPAEKQQQAEKYGLQEGREKDFLRNGQSSLCSDGAL